MGKRDLFELNGPNVALVLRTDPNPEMLRLGAVVEGHSNWIHLTVEDGKELRDSLDTWLGHADPRPSKLQTDMLAWADQMEEESSGVGRLLAGELRRRVFESVRK